MPKVERFEELNCWKAARILVKEVYMTCDTGVLSKDFDTRSQLKRASLSIMNNIAEGFGRFSNREFIRFS
jgi:four helix bundle protein